LKTGPRGLLKPRRALFDGKKFVFLYLYIFFCGQTKNVGGDRHHAQTHAEAAKPHHSARSELNSMGNTHLRGDGLDSGKVSDYIMPDPLNESRNIEQKER